MVIGRTITTILKMMPYLIKTNRNILILICTTLTSITCTQEHIPTLRQQSSISFTIIATYFGIANSIATSHFLLFAPAAISNFCSFNAICINDHVEVKNILS